jgi:hypothetical protein
MRYQFFIEFDDFHAHTLGRSTPLPPSEIVKFNKKLKAATG